MNSCGNGEMVGQSEFVGWEAEDLELSFNKCINGLSVLVEAGFVISDVILCGMMHIRRLQRFNAALLIASGLVRARHRARERLAGRCTFRAKAVPVNKIRGQHRSTGQEAAAVGLARLRRLQAAARLQDDLRRDQSPSHFLGSIQDLPSAPVPWEEDQRVLQSGLPPARDWDTLHTRYVSVLRKTSHAVGRATQQVATAYLVSLPYAWDPVTGAIAGLANMQCLTGEAGLAVIDGKTVEVGVVTAEMRTTGPSRAESSAAAWVVYEPYFVLRWEQVTDGQVTKTTQSAHASISDTIVTLTQLEAISSCANIGTTASTTYPVASSWPCAFVGPDVASWADEVIRIYIGRYGDFRTSWLSWWAALSGTVHEPGAAGATSYSSPTFSSSPAFSSFQGARVASSPADALFAGSGAVRTPARSAIPDPPMTRMGPVGAPAAPVASPDMVSPGAASRAAQLLQRQLCTLDLLTPDRSQRSAGGGQNGLFLRSPSAQNAGKLRRHEIKPAWGSAIEGGGEGAPGSSFHSHAPHRDLSGQKHASGIGTVSSEAPADLFRHSALSTQSSSDGANVATHHYEQQSSVEAKSSLSHTSRKSWLPNWLTAGWLGGGSGKRGNSQ